ncbi:uncharacterized protein LOC125152808 isoform X2 [Prionailurus viverrinus]|uniref:uncharacterized protein LOC125152808 isoform X2 n=1 Tax=Prionailurus viverrinus TaxID=61388 RepID=UPI001FF4EDFF|nr:uncharacterized protein LOC125152808 isoform X2 [Prionailurus viverrinus]
MNAFQIFWSYGSMIEFMVQLESCRGGGKRGIRARKGEAARATAHCKAWAAAPGAGCTKWAFMRSARRRGSGCARVPRAAAVRAGGALRPRSRQRAVCGSPRGYRAGGGIQWAATLRCSARTSARTSSLVELKAELEMEDRYAIPPSALGRLHSVGFWEAAQRNKTASFHHVNLLPEDDSDLYICDIFPPHLVSVGIDKSSYEWMEGGGRLWGTVGQTLRFPGCCPAHLN